MRKLLKVLRVGWRFVSDVNTIYSFIGLVGLTGVGILTPIWSLAARHTGPEIFVLTLAAIALTLFVGIVVFGFVSDLLGRRAVYLSRLVTAGRGILAQLDGTASDIEFHMIFEVVHKNWTERTISFLTDEYSESVATEWDGLSPFDIEDWGRTNPGENKRLTQVSLHVKKLVKLLEKENE